MKAEIYNVYCLIAIMRETVHYLKIHRAKYVKLCQSLQRITVIDYNEIPIDLGAIIDDILIINWSEHESDGNWEIAIL